MFVENAKRTFIAGEALARRRRVRVRTPAEAVEEVQKLVTDVVASVEGTWTLTYDGHTTAAIEWNATTTQIDTALELLPNITAGDVAVTGAALDEGAITSTGMIFTWLAALGDVSMLEFDLSGLTGPTQDGSAMTETAKGVPAGPVIYADDEICIGVTEYAVADKEKVAVRLKNAGGSFEVEAEGIIAVGADCKGATDGRLVTAALANGVVGDEAVAIEASTVTGDLIEVIFKSDKMTTG